MLSKSLKTLAAVCFLAVTGLLTPSHALGQNATVLHPADTQKLLPPAVFYKGQSAPAQLRNSGGIKFADGSYMLATLVDTSGYSSDVATKYQAYFITEVALEMGGHRLPAGVYGVGFLPGNKFVVTDVGGHDVLTATSMHDEAMKRPLPLQVTADQGGGYRFYDGRNYVKFHR